MIAVCDEPDGAYAHGVSHAEIDTGRRFNDDMEAARAAERDGVRLVYGIPFVEEGVYVDTPENRVFRSVTAGKSKPQFSGGTAQTPDRSSRFLGRALAFPSHIITSERRQLSWTTERKNESRPIRDA